MIRGSTGTWLPQAVQGRDYDAFVPADLPPKPPLQWNTEIVNSLAAAMANVARLDGAARLLPDLHFFIYSYVRKEAVLSSQIEGTQSSLSDLLMFESSAFPGVPIDDVGEVVRYVQALELGIKRILAGESISLELLLDMHRTLLFSGRGASKDPGKVRDIQNWIGGQTPDRARFVPPPPSELPKCLGKLLNYWKTSTDNTLIKAALIHLQFETIHPFRDGNGRMGRLLIPLLLCQEKMIAEPMVYLSLYLKEHREVYYEKLQSVRVQGDWEEWILFFLKGISEVTESAFDVTKKIQDLFESDQSLIRSKGGRKSGGMSELYRAIQSSPILTIPKAEKILQNSVSKPTLYSAATELVKLGILSPLVLDSSGTQAYAYDKYITLLR